MDFMDPDKAHRHNQMVYLGYGLIAIAVLLFATILLFIAYGFGYKNGQVIQNGLVFFSAHPGSAEIYIDGKDQAKKTDTDLTLPAGQYNIELRREGYHSWTRQINVKGSDVTHYDYPFLFPTVLKPVSVADYSASPALMTQSHDRRWLIIAQPGQIQQLDLYDLKNTKQLTPKLITIPTNLLTSGTTQTLTAIEWANDNTHLLLRHDYDGNSEYIILDITSPEKSVNLTVQLGLATTNTEVALNNQQFDHYLIFNKQAHTLSKATLTTPLPVIYVSNVAQYESYGNDLILYAEVNSAAASKTNIDMFDGTDNFTIRKVSPQAEYQLGLTKYDGNVYAAVGVTSEKQAYLFKNPLDKVGLPNSPIPVPVVVLHMPGLVHVSFSANSQIVVAQSGTSFATYDIFNKNAFNYKITEAMDKPQVSATWMDSSRLMYISSGKLIVFDFDGTNKQSLAPASPSYVPAFSPSSKNLFTLSPAVSAGAFQLNNTSMLSPADQ